RWLAAAVFLAAVCFATAAAALPRRRRPWLAVATAAVAIVLLGVTIHDLAAAVDQSWFRVKVADLLVCWPRRRCRCWRPPCCSAPTGRPGGSATPGCSTGDGSVGDAFQAGGEVGGHRLADGGHLVHVGQGTLDDAVQALAGPDLLGRRDPAHVLGDQLELGGV